MGYFPYDERLKPIYNYCSENNLSVISHCSPSNSVNYRGSKSDLKNLLSHSIEPINWNLSIKELSSTLTHPKNYKYVLEEFPDLKICLAHFGSDYYWNRYLTYPGEEDNWFVIIKQMIEDYPNLYTDISFTLNNRDFFPLLNVILENQSIREKVLFGSDYYMVSSNTDERRFGIELRSFIGEEKFDYIANINAKRFLGFL